LEEKRRLSYKEAFFQIVEETIREISGETIERIFQIIEKLDDQEGAIRFANEIAERPIHSMYRMYPRAIEFLLKKANISVPENEPANSSLIRLGLGFLKKKALKSVGIVEKPEESEKAKELEPHEAGSEG